MTKLVPRPIKFINDDMKRKNCQLKELAQGFCWKTLQKLFASDTVLRKLKPNLIVPIQDSISTPSAASSILNWINGIARLLHDAGFVVVLFDVTTLVEIDPEHGMRPR